MENFQNEAPVCACEDKALKTYESGLIVPNNEWAKKAVLSISGGMDSTCLLMELLAQGIEEVRCLSFDYGQNHKVELKRVQKNIKFLKEKGFKVSHEIINLKDVFKGGTCALTGQSEVPEGHYADESMKSTVVPNRNIVFSSIVYARALAWANESGESVYIATGIHAGDHCFPKDTNILTPDGYKTIETLKIGDKVYSMNQTTGEVIEDTCENISKTGSTNELYKISTTTGDIRLTGKHKVYCVKFGEMTRSGYEKEVVTKLAEELEVGDVLLSPYKLHNSLEERSVTPIDILPIIKDIIKMPKYEGCTVYEEDEKVGIINNMGKRMTSYDRCMDAQSLLNIMAWYITEGWTSNQYKKNPSQSRFLSQFSQSYYKNLENTILIVDDLNNLNIPISVTEQKDKTYSYQFNSVISVLMYSCGENSKEKVIPEWIMNILKSNKSLIKGFLDTMIAGDGHINPLNGIMSYSTISKELAVQMSELFHMIDMYVKVTHQKNQIVLMCGSKERKAGLVRFYDGVMTKITSIEIEQVDNEDVYDITVSENHNFFAGEYGNVLIHNCIYPDCRPESQNMAKELFRISNWGSERVDYIAPFMNIDKGHVLVAGLESMKELGFKKSEMKKVLKNTNTCYKPNEDGEACGKCGSCIEENQKVLMADNTLKSIKDINEGDEIWAVDENTDKITKTKVLGKTYKGIREVYDMNGLLLTKDHAVMCSNGHMQHRKFREYQKLYRKDATYYITSWPKIGVRNEVDEEKYVLGYLRGFVDGDGSIHERGVCTCQKERDVLDEFWELYNKYVSPTNVNVHLCENKKIYIGNGGYAKTFLEKTKFDESPEYCRGYINGMIIADGCAPYNKCNHHFSIVITQSLSANTEKCVKIEKCLNILGITPTTWESHCGGYLENRTLMKCYQISYPYIISLKYGASKRTMIFNRIAEHCGANYLPKTLVDSIGEPIKEAPVYDIETEAHTFICEGYVVHNCQERLEAMEYARSIKQWKWLKKDPVKYVDGIQ